MRGPREGGLGHFLHVSITVFNLCFTTPQLGLLSSPKVRLLDPVPDRKEGGRREEGTRANASHLSLFKKLFYKSHLTISEKYFHFI